MLVRDTSVLSLAHEILTFMGIQATLEEGYLTATRDSMVQVAGLGDESECYKAVKGLLEYEFPNHYVLWAGRTDDFMGIDFFQRV